MFGLSFSKLLLLAVVVVAVWYGFRHLGRGEGGLRSRPRRNSASAGSQAGAGAPDKPRAIEDMVRCAVCGAFQTRGAAPCERADCPMRTPARV